VEAGDQKADTGQVPDPGQAPQGGHAPGELLQRRHARADAASSIDDSEFALRPSQINRRQTLRQVGLVQVEEDHLVGIRSRLDPGAQAATHRAGAISEHPQRAISYHRRLAERVGAGGRPPVRAGRPEGHRHPGHRRTWVQA
jgi:hypothetical protein